MEPWIGKAAGWVMLFAALVGLPVLLRRLRFQEDDRPELPIERQYLVRIEEWWGSRASLDAFLKSRVGSLCPVICGPQATVPGVQLIPSWLHLGHHGYWGVAGTYQQGKGRKPATIQISVRIANDRDHLSAVIAHELIHHWQALGAKGRKVLVYPAEAEELIGRERTGEDRKHWLASHNRLFTAKAGAVSRDLGVPLEEILFYKAR